MIIILPCHNSHDSFDGINPKGVIITFQNGVDFENIGILRPTEIKIGFS